MATTTDSNTVPEEHPDAPRIRQQVEYYFSDENLSTDTHLLQFCGGRENKPVSISRICGFKKMRGFKPKRMVVEALRKSAFLVVSDDGKHISRKVALQGPCALDADFYDDTGIAYDPKAKNSEADKLPVKPAKKPAVPPGMTKNMMKPTGFERTYIEAPITPSEAREEESTYHPDKSFVERIEIAIERFRQKKKMHSLQSNIFSKFMLFGGVDTAPRMFGGLSKQDLAEMDAEEIARAKAIYNVPWNRDDSREWVVDFTGVGEAFLSSYFPAHFDNSQNSIAMACQVLRSFYNYLMYHSVCDEYREDILKARQICDTAEDELPKIEGAGLALPGHFNTAASIVGGGSKANTYIGDKQWAADAKKEGLDVGDVGLMDEEARVIFRTAVTIMGTDEQQNLLDMPSTTVLKNKEMILEVIAITVSDEATREMYTRQNAVIATKSLRLEPLGRLTCRSWYIRDFDQYDLPKDKYRNGCLPIENQEKSFEFWVEDHILEQLFLGMKIDARVLTVEGGIKILDEVSEVMCSFFKWLPNELWTERHPKEVVIRKKEWSEEGSNPGNEGNGKATGEESDTES